MSIIKEFAQKLNGTEYSPYRNQFTKEQAEYAKEMGFIIITGASDDLVEFDGAFEDESGCFDGGIITFDENGTSDDGEEHANELEVYWCGKCGNKEIKTDAAWEYRFSEPSVQYETFDIMDDGRLYCRGLVVDITNLKKF